MNHAKEANNPKTPANLEVTEDNTDVQNIENSDALEESGEEKENEGFKRTH